MRELKFLLKSLWRSKIGAGLVAAQVALTMAIVSNVFFVLNDQFKTMWQASGVDDEEHIFTFEYMSVQSVDHFPERIQHDLDLIRAIPGVKSVALTSLIPFGGAYSMSGISIDEEGSRSVNASQYKSAGPFLETLGLTLVEGRDFLPSERRVVEGDIPDTAIITRAVAKALFPDKASVLGETVYSSFGADDVPLKVVGVVEKLIRADSRSRIEAHYSILYPIQPVRNYHIYAIRTQPSMIDAVMREVEEALMTKDRALLNNRKLSEARTRRYRSMMTSAGVMLVIALGLLVVTASGVIGVVSFWVSQRRKYIGIRRALGAQRSDILSYFLVEILIVTTIGVLLGGVASLLMNQWLMQQVAFSALPMVYVGATAVGMWLLGVAAALGPTLSASWVPPAVATRT